MAGDICRRLRLSKYARAIAARAAAYGMPGVVADRGTRNVA